MELKVEFTLGSEQLWLNEYSLILLDKTPKLMFHENEKTFSYLEVH